MSSVPCVSAPGGIPVLLYAHPFEVTLGVILVVNGVRQLATGDSSPAIDHALPPDELPAPRLKRLPIRVRPQTRPDELLQTIPRGASAA